MRRPVFSFRPRLENPGHKRAWEILQGVPEGQKNTFLVQAILQSEDAGKMEGMIRRVVREEIKNASVCQPEEPRERQGGIPAQMLNFLSHMDDEA